MPAIAQADNSTAIANEPTSTNTSALAITVTMFFFWGFVAASNGIFIPFCRTYFHLDQFQSQLIGSAFYGAYFVGSLALNVYS
ncbi:MAG: MFS transporter, partial [Clostridia bacterium]|nr:MFS transporter [Deltaproteobacteria bacterium]